MFGRIRRAQLNETIEEGEILESIDTSTQCKEINSDALKVPRRKKNKVRSKRTAGLNDHLIKCESSKPLKKSDRTHKSRAMSKSRSDKSDRDREKYGSLSQMEAFRKCVFPPKERNSKVRKVRQERRAERSSRTVSQEKENSKHSSDGGHHHHHHNRSKRRRSRSRKRGGGGGGGGKNRSRNRSSEEEMEDEDEEGGGGVSGDDSDGQRRSWKRRHRSNEMEIGYIDRDRARSTSADRHLHKWKKRATETTRLRPITDDSRLKDNVLMRKLLQSESLGANKPQQQPDNDNVSDLSCEVGSVSTVSSPDYNYLQRLPDIESVELLSPAAVEDNKPKEYSDDSEIEVIIPHKSPPPVIELQSDSEDEVGKEEEEPERVDVIEPQPQSGEVGNAPPAKSKNDDEDLDDLQLRLAALRSAVLKKHQERVERFGLKQQQQQRKKDDNLPAKDPAGEEEEVDSYHPSNRTSPMSPTSSYNFSPTQECHTEQDIDIDDSDENNEQPIVVETDFVQQNYEGSNNACFPPNNYTALPPQPLPPGVDVSNLPPEFSHSVFCAPPPPPIADSTNAYGFHHPERFPPPYFNHHPPPIVHPTFVAPHPNQPIPPHMGPQFVPTNESIPHNMGPSFAPPQPNNEATIPHVGSSFVPNEPIPPRMGSSSVPAQPSHEPIPHMVGTSFVPTQPSNEPMPHMGSSFVPPQPSNEPMPPHMGSSFVPPQPSNEPMPHMGSSFVQTQPSNEPMPPHMGSSSFVPAQPPHEQPIPHMMHHQSSFVPTGVSEYIPSTTSTKTYPAVESSSFLPVSSTINNYVNYQNNLSRITQAVYTSSDRQLEQCVLTSQNKTLDTARTIYSTSNNRQLEDCVLTTANQSSASVIAAKTKHQTNTRQLEQCFPTSSSHLEPYIPTSVNQNNSRIVYSTSRQFEPPCVTSSASRQIMELGGLDTYVPTSIQAAVRIVRQVESPQDSIDSNEEDVIDDENEELLRAKLLTSLSRKKSFSEKMQLVDTGDESSRSSSLSKNVSTVCETLYKKEINFNESNLHDEMDVVMNEEWSSNSCGRISNLGEFIDKSCARSTTSNPEFVDESCARSATSEPIDKSSTIGDLSDFIDDTSSRIAVNRPVSFATTKTTINKPNNCVVGRTLPTKVLPPRNRIVSNMCVKVNNNIGKQKNYSKAMVQTNKAAKKSTTAAARLSKPAQEETTKFIIRLGQDSEEEEESNCEDEENGRVWRRQVIMATEEENDSPVRSPITAGTPAPVVLEQRIDQLLQEVRRQHEVINPSSNVAVSKTANPKTSRLLPAATGALKKGATPKSGLLKGLKSAPTTTTQMSTPAAVKHLPKSAQEEYRRLKQAMAAKENQRRLEAVRNRLLLQKSRQVAATSCTTPSVTATSSTTAPVTATSCTTAPNASSTTAPANATSCTTPSVTATSCTTPPVTATSSTTPSVTATSSTNLQASVVAATESSQSVLTSVTDTEKSATISEIGGEKICQSALSSTVIVEKSCKTLSTSGIDGGKSCPAPATVSGKSCSNTESSVLMVEKTGGIDGEKSCPIAATVVEKRCSTTESSMMDVEKSCRSVTSSPSIAGKSSPIPPPKVMEEEKICGNTETSVIGGEEICATAPSSATVTGEICANSPAMVVKEEKIGQSPKNNEIGGEKSFATTASCSLSVAGKSSATSQSSMMGREKSCSITATVTGKSCPTAESSVIGELKSCPTSQLSVIGGQKSCPTVEKSPVIAGEKSCLTQPVTVIGDAKICQIAKKSCSTTPPVTTIGGEKLCVTASSSVIVAEKSCPTPPATATSAEQSCVTQLSAQVRSCSSSIEGSSNPGLEAGAPILADVEQKLIAERYTTVDKLTELSCEAIATVACRRRVARLKLLLAAERRELSRALHRTRVCARISRDAMVGCDELENTCRQLGGPHYRLPTAGRDLLKARGKSALQKKDEALQQQAGEKQRQKIEKQQLLQQNRRRQNVTLNRDRSMEVIVNNCRTAASDVDRSSPDIFMDDKREEVVEEEERQVVRLVRILENEREEEEEGEEKMQVEEEVDEKMHVKKDPDRKPITSLKCLPDYVSPLNYLQNSTNASSARMESNLSIFCPYDLMGSCRDEACPYQHSA